MEMNQELRQFNKSYNSIYDDKLNEYKKINNYYKLSFIDFDEHMVPFDNFGEGEWEDPSNFRDRFRCHFDQKEHVQPDFAQSLLLFLKNVHSQ